MLKSGFRLYLFCLFFILAHNLVDSAYGIDPFSHIKITSNKATCKKSRENPHNFIFNYIDKVNVILADGSKITSDNLEIIIDSNGINLSNNVEQSKKHRRKNSKKSDSLSNVKKITFKNNVYISNKNRTANANSAIINMLDNTCLLDGNVKIRQLKVSQNDVPLNVESSQAIINLKTSQVNLVGSQSSPVSTVIELGKNILTSEKKSTQNEQN